jgi:flagellar hook-associated protein 3 FlgL
VFWYTGENGSTPRSDRDRSGRPVDDDRLRHARQRAGDQHAGRQRGRARRDHLFGEQSECQASYQALSQSVQANLAGTSGTQSISDIEADLANAQTTVSNATTLNTQTQTTLQDMLQNIDGVNQNQIGEQILTLQNTLSASMSVTARLAQLSLVNYLAPSSG